MPTEETVARALEVSLTQFIEENGSTLVQVARLTRRPVPGLSEPLTPETLPRYVNIVLVSRPLVAALAGTPTELDARFMDDLQRLAEAMNSAAHDVRGDYGADDVQTTLSDALKLVLTLESVSGQDRLLMGTNLMTSVAELASDITAMNAAATASRFGTAGMRNWLEDGMTMYRALEDLAVSIFDSMSAEQRRAVGAQQYPQRGQPEAESRRMNFLTEHFQKPRELEEISQTVRDAGRARGLAVPDMSPEAAGTAEEKLRARNRGLAETILNMFLKPEAFVENSQEVRAFIQNEIQKRGLDQLEADMIDWEGMRAELSEQLDRFVDESTRAGRQLTAAQIDRQLSAIVTEALVRLQELFAAVDRLPERRADMPVDQLQLSERGFTPQEKRDIKLTAMHYGIHDVALLDVIARSARQSGPRLALHELSTPLPIPMSMNMELHKIVGSFDPVRSVLPPDKRSAPNVFAMYLALAVREMLPERALLSGVLSNLRSDLGKKVAASYLWLASQDGVRNPQEAVQYAEAINTLIAEIDWVLNARERSEAVRFDEPVAGMREIPSGTDGLFHGMTNVAGGAFFDPLEVAICDVRPRLSARQEQAVRETYALYKDDAQANADLGHLLPQWFTDDAENITRIFVANGGRPATLSQLWDLFTSSRLGKLPRAIAESGNFSDMMHLIGMGYSRLVRAVDPQADENVSMMALSYLSGLHVPVRRMFDLTAPAASLSLSDLRMDVGMGSLEGYTSETGYGLLVDFRRQLRSATWTFKLADGRHMLIHPGGLSNEENTLANPMFRDIIAFWRQMAGGNETMLCRIGQAFSQALLIYPRDLSRLFPGVLYDEHGNFRMSAVQHSDGRVIVDINTDEDAPVRMHEQVIINTDGTAQYAELEMSRA